MACSVVAICAGCSAGLDTSPGPPANVVVSPASSLDDQQPSLAADPSSPKHLAMAWMEAGARQHCWLGLSADGGDHWWTQVLVGPGGAMAIPDGHAACWNPSVAYGPHHRLYYLFQTSLAPADPYSHVVVTASGDGGGHFAPPVMVDPAVPPATGLRAGGDWWPAMAVAPGSGRLYVTWSRFTPLVDSSRILVAASADGARSFSAPTTASPPGQLDVTGSQVAVGADGTVYVAWMDYTQWERGLAPDGLSLNYKPAGLAQLMKDFYAAAGPRVDFTQGWGCGGLDAGPGHDVAVDRGGDCTLPGLIYTAASRDGGASFAVGPPPGGGVDLGCPRANYGPGPAEAHRCDRVHPSLYDHNLVALAAGRAGRLTLTWWARASSPLQDSTSIDIVAQPTRVWVATSADGGRSWQTAMAPPPSVGSRDSQHRSLVTRAPGGRLDIAYYDLAPSGAQQVYWSTASARTGTFSAPRRLSRRPSDSTVGPRGDDGWTTVGDHLALVSSNATVAAAWTDTSGASRRQRIVFAAVPSHPTPSRAWLWVALAGAAAVAAAAVVGRRRRTGRPAGRSSEMTGYGDQRWARVGG